mgnify:CR=1 FL=1
MEAGIDFDLEGTHEVTLADGSKHAARPVWSYLAASVADCTPEWAAEITGLDPQMIEEVSAPMPFRVYFTSSGMLVPGAAVDCSSLLRRVG